MEKQHPASADDAARSIDKPQAATSPKAPAIPAPATDPTNPHNQEPTGDWVAGGRAAERKNNEPGLTDEERKKRHL